MKSNAISVSYITTTINLSLCFHVMWSYLIIIITIMIIIVIPCTVGSKCKQTLQLYFTKLYKMYLFQVYEAEFTFKVA